MIGASGAIAAVLGAYLVLFPGARILSLVFLGLLLPADRGAGALVLGFWFVAPADRRRRARSGATGAEGGVAFFAHIGGFVAGVLARAARSRIRRAAGAALAA